MDHTTRELNLDFDQVVEQEFKQSLARQAELPKVPDEQWETGTMDYKYYDSIIRVHWARLRAVIVPVMYDIPASDALKIRWTPTLIGHIKERLEQLIIKP